MKRTTSCWLVLLLLGLSSETIGAQNPFDVPTLPALPVIVDTAPAAPTVNPVPMLQCPLYPFPMPPNPFIQQRTPNPVPPSPPPSQGPAFPYPQGPTGQQGPLVVPGYPSANQPNQGPSLPIQVNPYPVLQLPQNPVNPFPQNPVNPFPQNPVNPFPQNPASPFPQNPANMQGVPSAAPAPAAPAAPQPAAPPAPPPAVPTPVLAVPSYPHAPQPAETYPQALQESMPRSATRSSYPGINQFMRMVLAPVRGHGPDTSARHAPVEETMVEATPPGPLSPAEIAAARIKADEASVSRRRAAVRYLGRVDCQFNPEAEEGLLAALRTDRSEIVRFEAALALSNTCCCTKRIVEALHIVASGGTKDGHPAETSERVKWAALEALHRNTQAGQPQTPPPQELPPPRPIAPVSLHQTTYASPVPAQHSVVNPPARPPSLGLLPMLQAGRAAPTPAAPAPAAPARALPTLTPIGPIPPQYYP